MPNIIDNMHFSIIMHVPKVRQHSYNTLWFIYINLKSTTQTWSCYGAEGNGHGKSRFTKSFDHREHVATQRWIVVYVKGTMEKEGLQHKPLKLLQASLLVGYQPREIPDSLGWKHDNPNPKTITRRT